MVDQKIVQMQKKTTLKNFRYNRFLLLRYLLAGFFFTNLYWGLALILSKSFAAVFPVSLLVLSILASAEHAKLYGEENDEMMNKLRYHNIYQKCQIVANVILFTCMFFDELFSFFYPFLVTTVQVKLSVGGLLIIGVGLSLIILIRIQQIYQQKDKHFSYIQAFKEIKH